MNVTQVNEILRGAVGELEEGKKPNKKEVSKAFYKYFERIQIDIMAIPKSSHLFYCFKFRNFHSFLQANKELCSQCSPCPIRWQTNDIVQNAFSVHN